MKGLKSPGETIDTETVNWTAEEQAISTNPATRLSLDTVIVTALLVLSHANLLVVLSHANLLVGRC